MFKFWVYGHVTVWTTAPLPLIRVLYWDRLVMFCQDRLLGKPIALVNRESKGRLRVVA
jgi:hypothetical protein